MLNKFRNSKGDNLFCLNTVSNKDVFLCKTYKINKCVILRSGSLSKSYQSALVSSGLTNVTTGVSCFVGGFCFFSKRQTWVINMEVCWLYEQTRSSWLSCRSSLHLSLFSGGSRHYNGTPASPICFHIPTLLFHEQRSTFLCPFV